MEELEGGSGELKYGVCGAPCVNCTTFLLLVLAKLEQIRLNPIQACLRLLLLTGM